MPAGAPRTVSPSPEECVNLGEEMIQFLKENKKVLLFGEWYCLEKGMIRKQWKTLVQVKEFLPYYEKAQQILALRCINGTMKEGFGQRYIRLYDHDLTEVENAEARFKAELKAEYEAKKKDTESEMASKLANTLNKFIEQKEAKDGTI